MIAVALAAAPALAADAQLNVKDSQVPTKATSFANGEDCGAAGPARPGFDAWHLVLPGNNYDFTKVTGQFAATKTGPTIFTADAPGPDGVLPANGNSAGKHAYLFAPAGLWLTGATATISGQGKQPRDFVISHTCPGVPTTPSPSTSASPSSSPSASASPSASTSPSTSTSPTSSTSPAPSGSASPTESPSPSDSSPASPSTSAAAPTEGGLPITGAGLTGMLVGGLVLLAAGGALVLFARRRIARG
jgi:hypothetical protein